MPGGAGDDSQGQFGGVAKEIISSVMSETQREQKKARRLAARKRTDGAASGAAASNNQRLVHVLSSLIVSNDIVCCVLYCTCTRLLCISCLFCCVLHAQQRWRRCYGGAQADLLDVMRGTAWRATDDGVPGLSRALSSAGRQPAARQNQVPLQCKITFCIMHRCGCNTVVRIFTAFCKSRIPILL